MKNEVDFSKLAYWVLPGWICVLSFLTFVIIDILAGDSSGNIIGSNNVADKRIFTSVTLFLNAILGAGAEGNDNVITAIGIAAATLPLGFSIYQVYFYIRWNSPFSRDGLLPPLILGRMNDLKETLEDIKEQQLYMPWAWRKRLVKHPFFTQDHRFRARYVELLFHEAAQKLDTTFGGLSIYSRHHYLQQIMHTLGASTVSIYLGFFTYLYYKVQIKHLPLPVYLGITFIFSLTLFLLLNWEKNQIRKSKSRGDDVVATTVKEHDTTDDSPIPHTMPDNPSPDPTNQVTTNTRVERLKAFIERLKSISVLDYMVEPAPLLIFALASFHLVANPVLSASKTVTYQGPSRLTIALIFIVAAIWIIFSRQKSQPDSMWVGRAVSIAVPFILVVSLAFNEAFIKWIDWPFFTALLAFILGNLVLFKNRYNTKDEIFSLEYYTLRRYLTERQHHTDSK